MYKINQVFLLPHVSPRRRKNDSAKILVKNDELMQTRRISSYLESRWNKLQIPLQECFWGLGTYTSSVHLNEFHSNTTLMFWLTNRTLLCLRLSCREIPQTQALSNPLWERSCDFPYSSYTFMQCLSHGINNSNIKAFMLQIWEIVRLLGRMFATVWSEAKMYCTEQQHRFTDFLICSSRDRPILQK